ncbi:MAG: CapA family protein [Chloroflexi bacterium]|nr:CapA family protein [Chloroflexota bacterium]
MAEKTVSIYAVGDVAAFFKDPDMMFRQTAQVLNEADITFCQNERHYTDRYSEERDLMPGVLHSEVTKRGHASALKVGGFDVMSFASNHCMDLGGDAMLDTIDTLRDNGFAVIGVGKNIAEARAPAIFECRETRVAFLAYASVIRPRWEASAERPGCAPMRASTVYRQVDYQPGTSPAILTLAYPEDVEAMIDDINKVRALADVVVVSFHWGIHFVHGTIATYQKEVAHKAIEAGADMVIGHHPHLLKGIEVYRGKVVFYSMGNFAFDMPLSVRTARQNQKPGRRPPSFKVDPEYAEYCAWPAESLRSMIVKCLISDRKIKKVSFLPVLINCKAQPVVLSRAHEITESLRYMTEISTGQDLDTKLCIEGGEIVVTT